MSDPLARLKSRFEEIQDLDALTGLLAWDQRTMMPQGGSSIRGRHMALLQRLAHEKLSEPEVGRLLDELGDSLDPETDDGALVRVARRAYDKAVRVPPELSGEMARASAESAPLWMEAKAKADFSLFLPTFERNLELRRRYIACFEPREEPYDILLDDFEPEMETAEVRRIFDEIKPALVELVAEQRELDVDDSFLDGEFPVERQEGLSRQILELFGTRPNTWRVDPTEHPFSAGAGIDDIRITTHYYDDSLESLFSTMHEYGHGLYEHQVPAQLALYPTGTGASLALHESQSRLW
ncbi:MAG: carboxypeptidase M32, partial [Gaiellaceae bacterium]